MVTSACKGNLHHAIQRFENVLLRFANNLKWSQTLRKLTFAVFTVFFMFLIVLFHKKEVFIGIPDEITWHHQLFSYFKSPVFTIYKGNHGSIPFLKVQ